MATINSVVKRMYQVPRAFEVRPEITEIIKRQTYLSRLSSPFPEPFVSKLYSVLPTMTPTLHLAQTWAAHQQRLLQVTSLFGQIDSSFGITSRMLQRTASFLESFPQDRYGDWAQQPWALTDKDEERVRYMIAVLAPAVAGRPHDEARAWLMDLVAVGFFAPSTEACDELDDDTEMAELLICELERAFSAAQHAGELWDQRDDGGGD